ncbi:hypothetical protein DRQ25_00920 [Candidatus Fermentibacteria bacterium]|nr:MAG: hypothetical protein DRQ25_00920 [Candidatus Fermentibacteria bacterium]
MARQFIKDGDIVLDACCGTGYGIQFLKTPKALGMVRWIGIDKKPIHADISEYDFEREENIEIEPFDVFVGLECIEHLNHVGVINFVGLAKQAKKYIVISTPITPNSNPFHVQQFTREAVLTMFKGGGWEDYAYFEQDEIYGIFIFKKTV